MSMAVPQAGKAGNVDTTRDPDEQRMQHAIAGTAARLHDIASRTQPAQIAREVLRLNDAVRAAATPKRLHYTAQPADFMAALLALADPCNGDNGDNGDAP
jgi:hypothetical protein